MTWTQVWFSSRQFGLALTTALAINVAGAQSLSETRDPNQQQDAEFAQLYAQWTGKPSLGSPLVDHLPRAAGIPTPKDVLGHHAGAPATQTHYADLLRYYRALERATPRVKVETIGRSDEGRELVVIWVSSEENIRNLAQNRANLAKLADPRSLTDEQARQIIAQTRPNYHVMGGLHSREMGPPEMLMELAYRLAVETSPIVSQIRNNVIVSITPAADADGWDRNVDWFYRELERRASVTSEGRAAAGRGGRGGRGGGGGGGVAVPYWGKYVFHDNNRDINLSQRSTRAITDWYFTAYPPIVHDLHETARLLYIISGAPPQNPNYDPVLFSELQLFANWEVTQLTKWGMPGVYSFGTIDAWGGSFTSAVASNHNGVSRLYEQQAGADVGLGGAPISNRPGTGRGIGQPREWFRGIPAVPAEIGAFSRRANTNYSQTGVLSALHLTSLMPQVIVENFYLKTRNSINTGATRAPFAYIIPVQRDRTRPATLVNILRAQRVEVGTLNASFTSGNATYPAGSYVIKLNQPYGRFAKMMLEKQILPESTFVSYADMGWTMGAAFNVDVRAIDDKTILAAPAALIEVAKFQGMTVGRGTAGVAVAHLGSNNMVSLRYKLKNVRMRITEKPFVVEGVTFPPGSLVATGPAAALQSVKNEVATLGLTAAALSSVPAVPMHEADAPRVALYSSWTSTQDLGWYRHAFDQFGIPFHLIYKERVAQGNLRADYDVILMAGAPLGRDVVMAAPAARPVPYQRTEKYKSLGMYGETADMTGGFGAPGVAAFAEFLDKGGTLIAIDEATSFPIDFGFSHSVVAEPGPGTGQGILQAEITRPDHPIFYGYASRTFPVMYTRSPPVFTVPGDGQVDVLARYVGGDSGVLSGSVLKASGLRERAFVVDIPGARDGAGRVIMFGNNPIYRWQTHGEFNMVFNALLNWNDVPSSP